MLIKITQHTHPIDNSGLHISINSLWSIILNIKKYASFHNIIKSELNFFHGSQVEYFYSIFLKKFFIKQQMETYVKASISIKCYMADLDKKKKNILNKIKKKSFHKKMSITVQYQQYRKCLLGRKLGLLFNKFKKRSL